MPVQSDKVRELKDFNRTPVSLYVEAVAGAASEALLTLNQSTGFAAPSTGTSFSVPVGKTLRIMTLVVSWVATTTTANTTRIRLRVNTGGAAIITSPIAWTHRVGLESATFIANEAKTILIPFPDGLEIPAGSGVAISHLEAAANGTLDICALGYLYS